MKKPLAKILTFILIITLIFLFTSQQNTNNNVNGFFADAGSFEILSSYQGKGNVLKVDGAKTNWFVARYSLSQYKGKLITIEITADVSREGAAGDIHWQVNNAPSYPTLANINNAASDVWHTVKGRLVITPTDNDPYIYLTTYANNSRNTVYYIANPNVTITEGDGLNPDFSLTPLKSVYANDFLIGNIIDGTYMAGKYFDLLKHHFNIVTSTTTFPIQLAPLSKGGNYQFTYADNMLDLMGRNNIPVHGHVLVWHEVTPDWMFEGTREEVIQNMNNYIAAVLGHFKGRINSWDVVNEAIKKENISNAEARGDWRNCLTPRVNYWAENHWYNKLGADYIELAFRAARAADPNITLYYNDDGLENPNKAEVVRKMIQDINDRYKRETRGTRNLIEGVGSQAHIYDLNLNINNVRTSLEKLISLGIEISISELDISAAGFNRGYGKDSVMSERDETAQAVLYARLMNLYRENSAHIKRITFWGIDDGTSWLSAGNPALFNRNLNAKQAFHALSNPDSFLRQYSGRTRR